MSSRVGDPEPRATPVMTVLVVDGELDSRRQLVEALRRRGYPCEEAADGAEGWKLFRAHPVDVIFSAWTMPRVGGLELCRRVRKAEESPYTYLVITTGRRDKEHIVEAIGAGADDFLRKPLDEDELQARLRVAERVILLEHRLREKSEQLRRDSTRLFLDAHTDPVTGIANRRQFDEDFVRLAQSAARGRGANALAMCDIDHFKEINDRFGHRAGDLVLRAVARAIAGALRHGDTVYRYGGEEFVVLLRRQDADGARIALERVRAAVEATRVPEAPDARVTLSAGVTDTREGPSDAWLPRADEALYEAKRLGRNRVVVRAPRLAATPKLGPLP